MVTFLVQKKLIKYGLKDKSFLDNKANNKAYVKDKVESKLLAPEEEKKNKELKNLLEAIQNNLTDDKFDEACLNFSKIKQLKNYEWFEVCGLWTYVVKKRNTRYVKIILDLISKNQSKNMEDQGNNSHNIVKTKNKLCGFYGHSRMKSHNPYELYDHKSINSELIFMNQPPPDPQNSFVPIPNDLSFSPADPESFKSLAGQFNDADLSGRLTYAYVPPAMTEESIYEMDITVYKPNLDKNGVREQKNSDFNYINHNLLIDMYDLLMFSGDIKFSSIAAEIIYSTAKLDDMNFVNWCASHYFANRRNQVFHEMLETNYNKFVDGIDFTRIEGKIEIVGKKSKQEVVMFSPKESDDALPLKIHKKNSFSPGNMNSMFKEGEFILLMTRKHSLNKIQENLYEDGPFMDKSEQGARRYQTTLDHFGRNIELLKRMGFSAPSEMTCVMAYISEISPNLKLKLYVLFEEQHYKYLEFPEQNWYIVRNNSHGVPNYQKICEALKLFCTKISMNPSIQQVLLSTPLSNYNCLNKLIRSSAISTSPSGNEIIKNILVNLEDKLNLPQMEAVKNSLFANLTLVQSPPGTNKVLSILEIVKAWNNYSSSQVLIYSKNKANIEVIHMALLKTKITSLCLSDEIVNSESIYEDTGNALGWICQNNFNVNPFNIRYENLKSIIEQFKVVCCTSNEILSENLKSSRA